MTGVMTDRLKEEFAGELIRPSDAEYDSLRRIYNGMIDRRPAVIWRCTSAADVIAAVNYGRGNGMDIAVHGGGHGVSGHAVCDHGLMIDLRPMKGIEIDIERRRACVQSGLTWAEFDAATQRHGLAVTGGRLSTTGIAGLTLGSGSGWLERKLGVTADSLLSVEVVLADGSLVTASEREHEDLFWGLRGGKRELRHRHRLRLPAARRRTDRSRRDAPARRRARRRGAAPLQRLHGRRPR